MSTFDPDHALAILLQAKLNEEAKKTKERGKENQPVPLRRSFGNGSLIDPEWETTDPCPDIHGLFIAFNNRFFYGRLLGVEVKWSPQMTSCAGICVYEGRNGLCSVRLSAPLLKLRPRSDLIETLLHEMIHAYLFVTNNNRDRDGHGPEFHKHMNRINKDAGTNISVYHSFHAEVKVYQQHWWRCKGPCQYRAPFFGMVKRAKNRVPGPNDLWWADHQASCGGGFVKVREPDGYKSKKKQDNKVPKPKDGKDIRNFFKKPSTLNVSPTATVASSKVGNNVFGFNDLVSKSVPGTGMKSPRPGSSRGGMLANRGGGTFVVTGSQGKNKQVEEAQSSNSKLNIDNFKVFSGQGFTLGGASSFKDRFKSRLLSTEQEPEQKRPKMINGKNQHFSKKSQDSEFQKFSKSDEICKCSVCNKSMPREEIDFHLEACEGLQNVFNNSSTVDNADELEISDINKKYKVVSCPVCALHIEGDINAHLDGCLNTAGILNVSDESSVELIECESPTEVCAKNFPKPMDDDNSDVEIIESEDRVACPICGMRFGESRINGHVNQCLDSDDDM